MGIYEVKILELHGAMRQSFQNPTRSAFSPDDSSPRVDKLRDRRPTWQSQPSERHVVYSLRQHPLLIILLNEPYLNSLHELAKN